MYESIQQFELPYIIGYGYEISRRNARQTTRTLLEYDTD